MRYGVARRALGPILLALVVAACSLTDAAADCATPRKPANLHLATVARVSGGDTVVLRFPDGRPERTRLIGIDAPEVHESAKLERDA